MKDLKISKELIKNVLVKETENLSEDFSFYIDEDYIVFRDEGETLFDYNIYKFTFKCKEWAFDKGYPFNVLYRHDYWDRCELKYDVDLYNHRKSFCSDIEDEAIFLACEYILNNIKQ